MGIASSGISAPLGQLTPITPLPTAGLTSAEIAFLQALSPAFQAILYEVDGMKTAWGGSTAAAGRQALSQVNTALGYSRSVEVPGVLGSVARALAVNWNSLAEEFSALKIKMLTTPLSLKQGGTGADGTTFTLLDLIHLNAAGTALESTGILSTDLAPLLPFFDGSIEETIDTSVFVDTGVITFSVQKDGEGDLNVYFAGTRVAYDTSPAPGDTVSLTAGTDIAPQENFVFLTESGGSITLNANTTGFPSGTPHARLATVFCQSISSLDTDGPFKVHAWTDHLKDANENGHLAHLLAWARSRHARYISGVAPGSLTDNLFISTTAGVVSQLHLHTMPVRTMSADPGDPVWVVNDPTTLYNRITALSGITQDADGTSITNRYFNIVLWGVVSEDETDCKLFINLPSGVYTVESRAQLDDEQTANFSFPSQFTGTAFLIARYTLKDTASLLTESLVTDLRGTFPSGSPGGGPGITDHGDLAGLGDDDHTQYLLIDGTRAMSGELDMGNNTITRLAVIKGANGNEVAAFTDAASDVTYITFISGASGVGPILRPAGEANLNLTLDPVGTGIVVADSAMTVKNSIAAATTNADLTLDGDGTGGVVADGRNIGTDGTKLDTIETSADVTDATNVNAAGAIMHTDRVAKGNLLGGLTTDEFGVLAVGTNGKVLVASSGQATGLAWSDAPSTRQANFSFVNPTASQDFLLDGVPLGATITECYAIVIGGTSVVFSVVMRARSAPFSGGTNIVSAQTATTTGATKTLASTTYTADNVLRLTTGTVTGTVTELLVLLKYTMDVP